MTRKETAPKANEPRCVRARVGGLSGSALLLLLLIRRIHASPEFYRAAGCTGGDGGGGGCGVEGWKWDRSATERGLKSAPPSA